MLWSCNPKDIKSWTDQDKERLDNTLDMIFSIEDKRMVYEWSEMYYGLTHYGDIQAFRRATVNHVCNDVYILSKWYKGCGFSPEEVRFNNLDDAKKAGVAWTEKAL